MCLDLRGGQAAQGCVSLVSAQHRSPHVLCSLMACLASRTLVQLWECTGFVNQQWVYDPPSGAILYGNGGIPTQLCLDAGGMHGGTELQVRECNNLPQQQWGYDSKMLTLYLRKSLTDASTCMDLFGGGVTKGTSVDVWGCSGCWK